MLVGSRVVRGPSWKFEDQDGGEGFVGTITSIEHFEDGGPLPKGTVFVYWDTGYHGSYRAGQDGCYDLRILDSAPAGVKFSSHSCDGCNQEVIAGMRWQCTVCPDYDLCTLCYMDDNHDRSHVFKRFDASSNNGVIVGQRSTCAKIQAKGIFSLATVKTGNDWALEPLENGVVLELDSWEGVARSAAMVDWDNFCELLLRVGHEGKVDLKLVTPSSGPSYYEDHLPTVSLDDVNSLKKQNMGSTIQSNQNEGQQKDLQQELIQRQQEQIQRLQSQQSDHTSTTPIKSPPRTLPKPSPRLRNNNSNSSNVGEPGKATHGQATKEPTTNVKDLIKRMSQADMADPSGRTPVKAKAPAPPPPVNRVDPSQATLPKTSKKTRPAPPPPRPRSEILAGSDNIAPEQKAKETKAAPSRTNVASLRESLGNALHLDPTRSRMPQTKKPPARELICTSCDEKASKVVFEPCGDFVDVYCLGCARKLKRCLKCHEPIVNKMTSDGSQLPDNDSNVDSSNDEKVKELERQLAEVTRQIECPICMDEQSNVLFGCGHKTCWNCSELIRLDNNHCPICKQAIHERKRMF